MAKRNGQLPESLELLLDTMCNTFGGIVFIAIALIVISQMVTKQIQETQLPKITQEDKDNLRQDNEKLAQEIAQLEREMRQKQAAKKNVSEEVLTAIQEILESKSARESTEANMADLKKLLQSLEKDAQQLTKALNDSNRDKLFAQRSVEKATQRRERELQRLQQQIKDLKARLDEAKQQEAQLTAESQNAKPQEKLTFSMEETTSSHQYAVFLKNNRLYLSDRTDEVMRIDDSPRKIHFEFVGRGRAISGNNFRELDNMFSHISSSTHFVYIGFDKYSFDSLLILKKYLRSRKYMVAFTITDDFSFTLVDEVRASH